MFNKVLICINSFIPAKDWKGQNNHKLLKHKMKGDNVEEGSNWAGYNVNNDTFDDAKGAWKTQCLVGKQQQNAQVASWVGIGGDNPHNLNAKLIQAGTVLEGTKYYLFYEYVPDYSPYIDYQYPIACNQTINAEVYQSSPGYWCISLQVTNGSSLYGCPYYNWTPDQTTSEWVNDRAECGNIQNTYFGHLADFGSTVYSNTYARSTSHGWHTVLGYSHNEIIMEETTDYFVIAQPEPYDSPGATTFTDYFWKADNDGNSSCIVK